MFELIFCATLTLLPDFLYRRYAQGKRIGQEIDLFTVWYELRYGITGCLFLTILLITMVFYYHPSTSDVTSFFRTVTILPERSGRVKEVYAETGQMLQAGDRIFSLEDDQQRAAVDTARARVNEIEAQFEMSKAELEAAQGGVDQARSAVLQAEQELAIQQELFDRGSGAASQREVERLQNVVTGRGGALASAEANLNSVVTKQTILLPAQLATAEATLKQAEIDLAQSVVFASVDGELQQFALQPGDVVNPMLRGAGILVPSGVGDTVYQAAFNQIASQVLKPGMVTEILCASKPFAIVPMRIEWVQDYLASGQFRPSDQLLDLQDRVRPGTIAARMVPIFEGSVDDIPRGSKCIANAYTNNHDRLASEDVGFWQGLFLHVVDTVGVVHAAGLRIRALLFPVQTLVLSGH